MKKQSIAIVLALVAVTGVGGVVAPVVDAAQASAPCCKTGT